MNATLILEPSRMSINEAIQAQTGRFRVTQGSTHSHCCIEYSVIDMARDVAPDMDPVVCECFDINDAATICNLLNEKHARIANAEPAMFSTLRKH